jgi:hypothetical protein
MDQNPYESPRYHANSGPCQMSPVMVGIISLGVGFAVLLVTAIVSWILFVSMATIGSVR